MIAAAIADPELLQGAKENDARLAKLADPRTIGMDDAKARPLIDQVVAGLLHHGDDSFARNGRADGADGAGLPAGGGRCALHQVHPLAHDRADHAGGRSGWPRPHGGHLPMASRRTRSRDWPRLLYWGHYVAHDNNRDAMGMTLDLTRNVLNTYLGWHAQVLHDLHESVPFLYDNTVGDGPYNAWVDPMLADEWAELGWNNVAQMQSFGMPGVFTHGDFDTWSPGYLMFLAGDAQRHQPALRDLWQRRRGYREAHSHARGIFAHMVPAESAAADGDVVAARQQQLRADARCCRRSPTSRSTRITSSRTTTRRASARFRSRRWRGRRLT